MDTLDDALAVSVGSRRFSAFLLNAFAVTALLLSIVSIYGVIAYSVAQRTREIGLRMALGAQRRDVVGMVVRQGMQLALVGITIGLAAAFGLTRLMRSLLCDGTPTDLPTFGGVTTLLAISAGVASCVPAIRASFIDPNTALRSQ